MKEYEKEGFKDQFEAVEKNITCPKGEENHLCLTKGLTDCVECWEQEVDE